MHKGQTARSSDVLQCDCTQAAAKEGLALNADKSIQQSIPKSVGIARIIFGQEDVVQPTAVGREAQEQSKTFVVRGEMHIQLHV